MTKIGTNFPVPGKVLWAVDVDLATEVLRRGGASKPGVDYIRYADIKIRDIPGRIEGEATEKFVIAPGQGISLFLEKMLMPDMILLDDTARKLVEKSKQAKVHWWAIEQGRPIPSGLILKYDGVPPGHCTLTVERPMSVKAFLELVSLITFNLLGYDIYGPA